MDSLLTLDRGLTLLVSSLTPHTRCLRIVLQPIRWYSLARDLLQFTPIATEQSSFPVRCRHHSSLGCSYIRQYHCQILLWHLLCCSPSSQTALWRDQNKASFSLFYWPGREKWQFFSCTRPFLARFARHFKVKLQSLSLLKLRATSRCIEIRDTKVEEGLKVGLWWDELVK